MRRSIFAALVLALLAGPVAGGIYYEASTRTELARGKGQTVAVHAWVDGDKAKVAFSESNNPMLAEGTYLVTEDGGRTMLLVNPKEQTYAEWNIEAMLSTMGNVLESMGPMLKFEFTDQTFEKQLEEPGESLLGKPTTHYRFRSAYTLQMKVMGLKQRNQTENIQDIWVSDSLRDAGFSLWLRNDPPRTGIEDLDAFIAAQMPDIEGLPLRTIIRAVSVDKKGRESVTTTTSEVTVLRAEDIPSQTFVPPEGYRPVPAPVPVGMGGGEGEAQNPFKGLLGGRKN